MQFLCLHQCEVLFLNRYFSDSQVQKCWGWCEHAVCSLLQKSYCLKRDDGLGKQRKWKTKKKIYLFIYLFLRKKHTKGKTEAEVLPGFPEFQCNALRGLVLSSPFSLGKKKKKKPNMPCWNKENFHPFSVFPKLFSLLFSQTAFWMLTKFLTYSDPLKS